MNKTRSKLKFVILLIICIIITGSIPLMYAQDEDISNDDSIFNDRMDPDLTESPIEYRTFSDDEEEDESEIYTSTGLTLDELAELIIYRLDELEKELRIEISLRIKEEIKDAIKKELKDQDLNKDYNIDSKITDDIKSEAKKILESIGRIEKELDIKLSDDTKKLIIKLILEEEKEDLLKDLTDKELEELTKIILKKLNEIEKNLKQEISDETKRAIVKIILKELLEGGDYSEAIINKLTEDVYEDYSSVFFDMGVKTDSEKTHIVKKGDTLADLSFSYYTADDIKRGAHWIHIYEYSILKNQINPKTQPILPYKKDEALVELIIGQKISIPFFKEKYPSADELLKKHGFTINGNGKVEKNEDDVFTGIPINIHIDE